MIVMKEDVIHLQSKIYKISAQLNKLLGKSEEFIDDKAPYKQCVVDTAKELTVSALSAKKAAELLEGLKEHARKD